MSGGLVLALVGVWVLAQILKGGMLDRFRSPLLGGK